MRERLRNIWLLLRLLPTLVVDAEQRELLSEMMAFVRSLPAIMKRPLPEVMQVVARTSTRYQLPEQRLRDLADLAAALERRSVPGICLKRSLVRYRYLTPLGVPLQIVFGARFDSAHKGARKIAGHAWLEQEGRVYFESAENVTPFRPMFRWPMNSS